MKEWEPVSYHEISNIIGIRQGHISLVAKNVNDILIENSPVKAPVQKTWKDYVRLDLQTYVFGFLLGDDYTRLNTKQELVEVMSPMTGELIIVHWRIWHNIHKV